MKEFLKDISYGTTMIYFIVSAIVLVIGVMDSTHSYRGDCKKVKRIHYVFPAYKLGCWLGEEIPEKKVIVDCDRGPEPGKVYIQPYPYKYPCKKKQSD